MYFVRYYLLNFSVNLIFFKGSTGVPKGVVLPHESLVTTVKAFHFVVNPPRPGDIYLGLYCF